MNDLRNSTPFDIARDEINDLYDEARNFLDGTIETQEQADAIGRLLEMIRKAHKTAEAGRKDEKRPHDEAGFAVQEKWKPIITKANLAADTCKQSLTPFLQAQARAQAEKERIAREEAEAAERAAQDAFARSGVGDLEAREEAERLAKAAESASRDASRAAKVKAQAKGGARAVSLRSSYRASITDMQAFARYVWLNHRNEHETFLAALAQRLVNSKQREIPGVEIHEERTAA